MTIQSYEFSIADAAWLTEGYQTMINAHPARFGWAGQIRGRKATDS